MKRMLHYYRQLSVTMHQASILPRRSGFTIVELLIVVVIIAILAAITIVAYNGIQNRANDAVVQSDMRNTYNLLLQYQLDNGSYPAASNAIVQPLLVASKKSYSLTNNGYLYCRSNQDAAVVGRSVSGKGFYYGSQGRGEIAPGSWTGANATTCPLAGIATTAPGYGIVWYGLNTGWAW